jgi:hypothetical protein
MTTYTVCLKLISKPNDAVRNKINHNPDDDICTVEH